MRGGEEGEGGGKKVRKGGEEGGEGKVRREGMEGGKAKRGRGVGGERERKEVRQ